MSLRHTAAVAERVVVVGCGIIGSMHALFALRAGHEVIQLERDEVVVGASVRNFGLVWVSGRRSGRELELALRARALWEQVAHDAPGTGFRANGSITVVTEQEEVAVLERALRRPDAVDRGFSLLDGDAVRAVNPGIGGEVLAGLFAAHDAAVEPARVPDALLRHLSTFPNYQFHSGVSIADISDRCAIDAFGARYEGDRVILALGVDQPPAIAERLGKADLVGVRLHMVETEPLGRTLTTSVADANSLRYYPCFADDAAELMAPQSEDLASHGAQLLCVQRLDGSLTIGDTHDFSEPFDFALNEEAVDLVVELAEGRIGGPFPKIRRRWIGVYHQLRLVTDDQLYLRRELADGVTFVGGAGGRGMTCAPAIAEESFA